MTVAGLIGFVFGWGGAALGYGLTGRMRYCVLGGVLGTAAAFGIVTALGVS